MENAEAPKGEECYRKQIIEIIEEIDNLNLLEFIYNLLVSFEKKWGI